MIIEKLNEDFYYHFFNGSLINAYDYFGAHVKKRDRDIVGTEFLLYAPNATKVCVIGEFNNFKECKMKEIKEGFFYFYIKGNIILNQYKYVLYTKCNKKLFKADPYAFYADVRPLNNSRVYDLDIKYSNYKRETFIDKPMFIYEMHFGSWKRETNFISYLDLVDDLINYLIQHKFTHVEFLPIYEHPLDDSWGYMGTGYFAPTARYGTPNDFYVLIEKLHESNIKVILDWVPGHICKDSFSLYMFDGTPLFEYEDERLRENSTWGTANLDFSKGITKSFLLSNALFWLKKFNIDGFRIDAVSNLIYYLGDEFNGINHNAISFLKELSSTIKQYDSNCILIAEDSSAYPNVTRSSDVGLGFDFKWNMGWMNDSLTYFKLDPLYRKYHHKLITFSFLYIFKEKYILPISHDEVVHLKKSLFNKMFGDEESKFLNMKLFLSYMISHPGKKLLFMGQEFAQLTEWDFNKGLDFDIANNKYNNFINVYLKDLISIYLEEEALYKTDFDSKLFYFIEPNNEYQSVFIFSRFINNEYLVFIINALPISYNNYKIGVKYDGIYYELINSNDVKYGGDLITKNQYISVAEPFHSLDNLIEISLPKYGFILMKYKSV